MRQDRPGGGVPLRREQVAPVLDDEPGAEGDPRVEAPRDLCVICQREGEQKAEDGEPERELVNPLPEHVDARAQLMPLQLQHAGQGIGVL